MATVDFPHNILRGALKQGFSRDTSYGLVESQPAVGTPYITRMSYDRPKVYDLTFSYGERDKLYFRAWLEGDLEGGILPFNIDLEDESGVVTKEAWFMPDGLPQLQSVRGGVYTYSARIRTNE